MSQIEAQSRAPSEIGVDRRAGSRRRLLPYLLVLPIVLYEGMLILYPIAQGVYSSFTKTEVGGGNPTWVGLKNYQRMLEDAGFWRVMGNTLVYMLAVIVVALAAGLVTALILNRSFRGRTVTRGLMTLPWAFPEVPTVLVFIWILNPTFGVINVFARLLPGIDENLMWLLDGRLAMVWVILITAWKGFPFYSLVIIAALQTVPADLYDAAHVDGANPLQAFRHVTLPSIAPTLLLLAVLASIFSFKQFTLIWLLTGGGPSGATETVVVRIYNTAFRFYDFSYGATIGVAGFLVAMFIALVFVWIQVRQEQGNPL
ncbi:MAG: sugar ABC transporter permease [Caldilineaceae bacterium]|nr:sugar ABC transporter permease [Caldilineaceae bacterium]